MAGDEVRLNLGCGGQVADGWVNIDRAGDPPIIVHDLRDALPFPDHSVERAVAHHVLDLLEADDLRALLVDVERVLVPAGVLRISNPSLTKGLGAIVRKDLAWFTSRGAPTTDLVEAYMWWLTCGGARKTILATPGIMGEYLDTAGFKWTEVAFHETTTVASICDLDSREDESFYVEATKP